MYHFTITLVGNTNLTSLNIIKTHIRYGDDTNVNVLKKPRISFHDFCLFHSRKVTDQLLLEASYGHNRLKMIEHDL